MNQKESAADWFAQAFVKGLDQWFQVHRTFPKTDSIVAEVDDILESIVANMMRSAYGVPLRLEGEPKASLGKASASK